MAKKMILGIDIGYDQLKLALVSGGEVIGTASAAMPENLMVEGRITSRETMSELIRTTMKENRLKANHAAIVLPNEAVYIKNVSLPQMTADQLAYNLPFEFNDYITGEIRDYVFDYAVLPDEEDGKGEGQEDFPETEGGGESGKKMNLMAVGAQRSVLEDAQAILRKAGLRMKIAAPAICAYISLIRAGRDRLYQIAEEFGILDLGYEAIRLYMFKGDRHVATRVLEIGLATLDDVIADAFGVDVHLAHTYLMTNYENCLEREECLNAYENIAVELMRAVNFYRFSNPDSTLSDLWICGGGAVISPLTNAIGEMLDMELHPAEELVPDGGSIPDCNSFVQAIGITFQ